MANSDITKRAIASAFLQLLEKKSFDRITVTAIAATCGINRQTFYYHFHDIYDLLSWIVEDSVESFMNETAQYDWQHKMIAILMAFQNSQGLVIKLFCTTDVAFFYHLLRDKIYELVLAEVDERCSDLPTCSRDREVVADFYTGGLIELLLTWIESGMRDAPEVVVHRWENALQSETLMRFSSVSRAN